jgi:hypothetical protein
MTGEQAGVGAVDAGETNQRGGNPCKLHLKISYTAKPREREASPVIFTPNTLFG